MPALGEVLRRTSERLVGKIDRTLPDQKVASELARMVPEIRLILETFGVGDDRGILRVPGRSENFQLCFDLREGHERWSGTRRGPRGERKISANIADNEMNLAVPYNGLPPSRNTAESLSETKRFFVDIVLAKQELPLH